MRNAFLAVGAAEGESDFERLQGRWRNERTLLDGKPSEAFVGVEGIIDGHNLTWAFTNRFGERHAQEGTFELDPTQTPKHFDLTYRSATKTDERIYALEGDTLRMGYVARVGTRPNSFQDAKFQFECRRLPPAEPVAPPNASAEAIQRFQESLKASKDADAEAQFRVGKMYFGGAAVGRDLSEAVRWFRVAADQGVAGAMSELGFMYRFGLGVGANDKESARLLQAAAEKGAPTGDEDGIRWFREAAEGGYARAQWSFGALYESGKGVPKDANEAFRWYHRALHLQLDLFALHLLEGLLLLGGQHSEGLLIGLGADRSQLLERLGPLLPARVAHAAEHLKLFRPHVLGDFGQLALLLLGEFQFAGDVPAGQTVRHGADLHADLV